MTIPLLERVNSLVIHHTATPEDTTVESIRQYHVSRGWGDIGYHYLIRQDQVVAGRPPHLAGAHAPGWNRRSIAVALVGSYLAEDPRSSTLSVLEVLVRQILADHPGASDRILSHREAMTAVGRPQHTDCPGRDWVGALRFILPRAWTEWRP